MTAWNTNMDDLPEGIPVLLKMTNAPLGWSAGPGYTVTIGQVGDGSTPGIWTSDGFFPAKPARGKSGAEIFVAWADIPR